MINTITSVRITDQYSKFKMHDQNRVLRDPVTGETKVRKDLVDSMKARGFVVQEAITCYANDDGSFTIIDGHNRLIAAQSLGIPVAFIPYKRDGKAEWTPNGRNVGSRPWNIRELANGNAHAGNEHYAELIQYCDRTGISITQAASMLYGHSAGTGLAQKVIKAGTFQIRDRMHADIVADLVNTCGKFVNFATDSRLVAALSACVFAEGFSSSLLKDKITRFPEQLVKQKSKEDYIELLDKIYNFFSKTRYELVVEVRKAMRSRNAAGKSKNGAALRPR